MTIPHEKEATLAATLIVRHGMQEFVRLLGTIQAGPPTPERPGAADLKALLDASGHTQGTFVLARVAAAPNTYELSDGTTLTILVEHPTPKRRRKTPKPSTS